MEATRLEFLDFIGENDKKKWFLNLPKDKLKDMVLRYYEYDTTPYPNFKQLSLTQSEKSSEIGISGELHIETLLRKSFPERNIFRTTKGYCGDIIMDDMLLIEIKNYSNKVPTRELNKFKRDMSSNNYKSGLFISLRTEITGIPSAFHYTEYFENGSINPIIYLSCPNPKIIELSTALLLRKCTEEMCNPNLNKYITEISNDMIILKNIQDQLIEIDNNTHNGMMTLNKSMSDLRISINSKINIILAQLKN